MNIGSPRRPGDPCALTRPERCELGCGSREAWRLRKVGHAEKWVCADYVGAPHYAFYLFYPALTTVMISAVRCWYKTSNAFKRRGFGDDTTSGSPWITKARTREHQIGGIDRRGDGNVSGPGKT